MPEIITTKGRTVLVDDEDYATLSAHQWTNNDFQVCRWVKGDNGKRKIILMHREVLKVADGQFVDHINGDPFDNRRANLRPCTHAQNMRNSRQQRNSHQPYKGIEAQRGNWRARIRIDNRRLDLGTFATAEEAALAYNFAAVHYHGEFARLNPVAI
jgi:hypothetical protein